MTSILIIEDDKTISRQISSALTAEGFICDCAFDGREGADCIEKHPYDLILLDLNLPKISGYDLLEYICTTGMPVMIVSAVVQVEKRIKALRMGADDYICKPFQIGELVARAETVLRRAGHSVEQLQAGDVKVSPISRQVWKAGKPVELTVKEFDLLVELIRRKNTALSRDSLYEAVWQEEYTGETRTLDSHIQRLRKKLGWEQKIKTVFRIGYRLEDGEGEHHE